MTKQIKKVKAKTDYLSKFRQTRNLGAYNFGLDLRKIKSESQLSPSQKRQITQIYGEYSALEKRVQNGTLSLHKPRHHKGESDSQYKKRLKAIQKHNNQIGSKLNYVVINAPKDSRVTFNNKNEIVVKRKNSDRTERRFPIQNDLLHLVINSPHLAVESCIALHNKEHPKKRARMVGAAFGGHVWKMVGVKKADDLADEIEAFAQKYTSSGDIENIGQYLTHIIVRY